MDEPLNSESFLHYAVENYDNQTASLKEFDDDMARFKYIKRLLRKYNREGTVNIRLLINHIIILNNVFPTYVLNRLLIYNIDKYNINVLSTVLDYLSLYNDNIPELQGQVIRHDPYIQELLEQL